MKKLEIYRTTDGWEFDDPAVAERHEKLYGLEVAYENARLAYEKALAGTQITADGIPFELSISHDYFYIFPGYSGDVSLPFLRMVSFGSRNFQLDADENGDTGVVCVRRNDGQEIKYRIGELYYHRRNAEISLLKEQIARMVELQGDILVRCLKYGVDWGHLIGAKDRPAPQAIDPRVDTE